MNIESVRESLAQAPRIVEGLVAAAPPEALMWREADQAWHIVEVLCHIADGEITDWMPRVERILSGGGRFMPYDREGGFTRPQDRTRVARNARPSPRTNRWRLRVVAEALRRREASLGN